MRISGDAWQARDCGLDAVLETFLAEAPDVPGVAARIEQPGRPAWTGAAGTRGDDPPSVMTHDVTFRVASNTKPFTSAAALRLWEQGQLSLDAPVSEFLAEDLIERLNVIDGTSWGRRITIEHLLQHSSGIREPRSETYVAYVMSDPTRSWTPLEQIEYAIANGPGVHPPGEAVCYSNTGFIILAVVIEQISGTALASALRELLRLDDLRLDSVHLESLEPTPASAGPRVRQYMGSLDVSEVDPSIDLYGGGGIVSNVRDLVGFWRELFGGRVFDSPATLERMTVTRRRLDVPGEAGLGIFRELRRGREYWYHTGFWGSAVRHEATSGLTLACATNQVWSPATTQAVSKMEDKLMRTFDMHQSYH